MCNKNKCFYELFENYKESLKIDLKNIDENDYKTICDSFDKLKASCNLNLKVEPVNWTTEQTKNKGMASFFTFI